MRSGRKQSRHDARRIACQTLYGLSFMPVVDEESLKQSFDLASGENCDEPVRELAWNFASGAYARLNELDETINALAHNWSQNRMGKMERAFLRLALYEMLYQDTPPKVVISETLEMADQFGNGAAKNFLNGVLHAAYKNAMEQK